MFQHLLLFGCKIRNIVQFVNISHVFEHKRCVSHILVNIVEVGQHNLSPGVEMVERLCHACHLHKCLMKIANKFYWVCNYLIRMFAKQFTDSKISRAPHRSVDSLRKIFVKEQACPLVGEDDGCVRQIAAILPNDIFCYIFQKCLHAFTSTILFINTYHTYPFTS